MLSGGDAKLVYMDGGGNAVTLAECSSDKAANDLEKTVSFSVIRKRLPIVGYDWENVDLTVLKTNS